MEKLFIHIKNRNLEKIEKKWYVLRAISGKEAKVKEYLEADLKNSDLGEYVSQVLIPTEKVYQVRNGKNCGKREVISWLRLWEARFGWGGRSSSEKYPNVIGFGRLRETGSSDNQK